MMTELGWKQSFVRAGVALFIKSWKSDYRGQWKKNQYDWVWKSSSVSASCLESILLCAAL